MIIPLFKKGDRDNPKNYRGISLPDSCSKIFTTVLNKRLNLWSETMHGFRQEYSIIDNIFILQSMVQKSITKNEGRSIVSL